MKGLNYPVSKKVNDIRLIYNPFAGKKRRVFGGKEITLEYISYMMNKYQIPADFTPISKQKRALKFAKESVDLEYKTVIAAGGDGTVSEVANGLVNSDVTLGILPLGTFMNIAKMLAINSDLESAVMTLKLGRTRKIDVGSVTKINGEHLEEPYYFLETAGVGLDAQLQDIFREIEHGNFFAIYTLIKSFITFYAKPITMEIDGKERRVTSTLITISNGPYTGASLKIAPIAKLNDHKLTVSLYRMSKWELLRYFIKVRSGQNMSFKKIEILQADVVRITSKHPRLVHADASLFGYTPVSLKIVPNAIKVICGFPNPDEESSLKSRTLLDP